MNTADQTIEELHKVVLRRKKVEGEAGENVIRSGSIPRDEELEVVRKAAALASAEVRTIIAGSIMGYARSVFNRAIRKEDLESLSHHETLLQEIAPEQHVEVLKLIGEVRTNVLQLENALSQILQDTENLVTAYEERNGKEVEESFPEAVATELALKGYYDGGLADTFEKLLADVKQTQAAEEQPR